MGAQEVQQPRDVGGALALLGNALDPSRKQYCLDVPIPETVDLMFPTQHGAEQLLLLHTEQIQTPAATRAKSSGLVDTVEDLPARLGSVHDRQGAEVAFVARAGDFVIAVEVGDPLVHGTPSHLAASLPLDPAANLELARVVDDRLDPQDLAELVVHLQPVVLDPVLDPRPGPTVLLAVGQHLAVEAWVQAAAQERQDVLGRKV
jgi:hypothetical protein